MSNPLLLDPREEQVLSNKEVLDMLQSNDPFIDILDLGNGTSPNHIDATIRAMQRNTSVRHVNLHICQCISMDQLQLLVPVLPKNLDISWDDDGISLQKCATFLRFLCRDESWSIREWQRRSCNIKSLGLCSSSYVIHDDEFADSVAHFLVSNTNLTSFTFTANQERVLARILGGVQVCSGIESLTLDPISLAGVHTFAGGVFRFPSLRELALSLNECSPSLLLLGAALANAQYSLTLLDISILNPLVGSEEIQEFLASLPTSCPKLTTLSLSINAEIELNDQTQSTMVEIFSALKDLKYLSLDIDVTPDILAHMKSIFSRINRLHLHYPSVQQLGRCGISDSLFGCTSLQRLHLTITDHSGEQLLLFLKTAMPNLANLEELVLTHDSTLDRCSSIVEMALLVAVRQLDRLTSVTLPSSPKMSSVVTNEIHYLCMLHSLGCDKVLLNLPLALYPQAIAKLVRLRWYNLVHHLISQKHGELIKSRLPDNFTCEKLAATER